MYALEGPVGLPADSAISMQDSADKADSALSLPDNSGSADDADIAVSHGAISADLDISTVGFSYSPLDDLGRCGPATALITPESLPTEPRGSIGMIKPSGWHTVRYDFIEGGYLYNRCHLIAYQLGGGNANERNLITGTRYMNTEGMLACENRVADYIRATGNSVLYRATPVFTGDNLVADGVKLEAWSVEDNGTGLSFDVFVENVQPGVIIDYASGESRIDEAYFAKSDAPQSGVPNADDQDSAEAPAIDRTAEGSETPTEISYVLNTNTMRFHYPYCRSVGQMSDKNRKDYTGDRQTLIEEGYVPCGNCKP